jgi:DNA-binding transcriptional MerR regulator
MQTPQSTRPRETARKNRRRYENRRKLQRLKQKLYFRKHGIWIDDPRKLHWHHKDPHSKYKKISHLVTRSWDRILKELKKCDVVHELEHRALHGGSF